MSRVKKNGDYSFIGGFRVLGLGFRATQDYIGVKCGMKGGCTWSFSF